MTHDDDDPDLDYAFVVRPGDKLIMKVADGLPPERISEVRAWTGGGR